MESTASPPPKPYCAEHKTHRSKDTQKVGALTHPKPTSWTGPQQKPPALHCCFAAAVSLSPHRFPATSDPEPSTAAPLPPPHMAAPSRPVAVLAW